MTLIIITLKKLSKFGVNFKRSIKLIKLSATMIMYSLTVDDKNISCEYLFGAGWCNGLVRKLATNLNIKIQFMHMREK
ncbi:MAG: hypothetical protein CM15mP69_5010 [Ectothiorhodospiraceae bacterium]|nr:MAG: hypothetical protein CM15mP69_5010 [Ectothiorhodospiraceae bacterium]